MPFVTRQRTYYKDGVEVPESSITDFGRTAYFKNIVTTKYWKEITTGSKELEYACYYLSTATVYWYAKAPIGSDLKWYRHKNGASNKASSSTDLVYGNIDYTELTENSAIIPMGGTATRLTTGDLYINTTTTTRVEVTVYDDWDYTTEEIVPVEVSADEDYDYTEFVPSTQFDNYEDKHKLYSLVKNHKTYYKYGTELNATVVGSFARLDKGVASGFSTSNYLKYKSEAITANTFEQVIKITTGSDVTTRQAFLSQTAFKGFGTLQVLDNHLIAYISSNGSTNNITDGALSNLTLNSNTDYWIKYTFNGSTYNIDVSTNSQDYVNYISIANSSVITSDGLMGLGLDTGHPGSMLFPFLGSIDLNKSYININGERWWSGDSYTKVGSWIDNGIASGFVTDSAYLRLSNVFAPENKSWEIVFRCRATAAGYLFGQQTTNVHTPQLCVLSTGALMTYISSKTSSWDIANGVSSTSLIDFNKWYYIKTEFTGTQYIISVSENGLEYTPYITINSTLNIYKTSEFIRIGGDKGNNHWSDSIDLTKSYIKINNKDWWHGTKAVESTKEDFDYYTTKIIAYDPYFAKYERISQVFSVGNLQTYIVPENVTKLNVVCRASSGANSEDGSILGGGGGSVKCDLSVTPGQTLYITVGGIPLSAGTPSYNASDIRIFGTGLENRIIVAGGGGSAAWRRGTGTGGKGGGLTGGAGKDQDYAHAGKGGTQSVGGAGGSVDLVASQWSSVGGAGSLGMGGTSDNHVNHYAIGGCGGAGYYGGGGGGGMHTAHYNKAAGGGGGSSYTDDTLCDNVVHLQGVNNGEGYVKISYIKELK